MYIHISTLRVYLVYSHPPVYYHDGTGEYIVRVLVLRYAELASTWGKF